MKSVNERVAMKKYNFLFILLMVCFITVGFVPEGAYADDSLDGTWNLYSEVVKGTNKGLKTEHTVIISQDLSNGRIDGKTIDKDEKQIGRLSGLIKGTIIEMTFSYKKEVLRATLHLNPDGKFIGGIFRNMEGGEGIIYGLKRKPAVE